MLQIAHLNFDSPLVLAPLAGYSDLPFRKLCREFGAGLCVSEMISCHGLSYGQKKTISMLKSDPKERPVSFQLFGADVEMMAKAADILNEFAPDLVDINMGCPVKKVTKKGAGAALMAEPKLAEALITSVVKNSCSPVTVKFRTGVDANSISCIDFAKMAEDSGASAVTVHGRTWAQGFKGHADWQYVLNVKNSVKIPVIGNGDISSFHEAMTKVQNGFCDGVMIGRGALGNPWAFSSDGRPNDLCKVAEGAYRHLELIERYINAARMIAAVKNHIGRYFKELKGSATIRKRIFSCNSFADLFDYISSLRVENKEIIKR